MSYDSTRAVFRILYPVTARPTFVLLGASHEVVDCSEAGMRYAMRGPKRADPPAVGAEVQGVVRFGRRDEVEVQGQVVRVEGRVIAVKFTKAAVPRVVIMREETYLRSHFPMWSDTAATPAD